MNYKKSAVSRLFELARSVAAWHGRGRSFELDEVIGPRSPRGGVGMPVIFDTGMINVPRSHVFGQTLGFPYPGAWHTYFNDFDVYAAGDWTITDTGAGTSALLAATDGGALRVSNAGGLINSLREHQLVASSFLMLAGKPCLFSCRLQINDGVAGLFAVGLQLVNANPYLPPADGIWFSKTGAAARAVDFNTASAAAGLSTVAGVAQIADATFTSFDFVYDGEKKVHYGVNGKELGSVSDANVPFVNLLAPVFSVKNGAAAVKTADFDYIFAAKAR